MDEYWEMLKRQMPLVEKAEQKKFKNARITVIGCGGLGGMAIEMLARLGVGELVVVDEDVFDLSNLNRQLLSTCKSIGQPKSEAATERVRQINPYVKVTPYNEHVSQENIDKLIKDSNVVIDCLDNVLTRVIATRRAREYRIPFIHGAIHGSLGQVSTFLSNTPSYEEMFNLPSLNKELDENTIESLKNVTSGAPPVFGPTPNLVSCIQAMEAYKIITGIGKVTVAPKMLTFDLLNLNSFSVTEI